MQLSSQNAFIHRWPGENIEPLRKVLLVFGEWNELDVAWLAQQGERMELEQQTTFIHEGETLDKIFVVLDGEADVLTVPPTNPQKLAHQDGEKFSGK